MRIAERASAIAAQHGLEVVGDLEPDRDHDAVRRITLLCQDRRGGRVVLSVGECRRAFVYPNGYDTPHLVIPKLVEQQVDGVRSYEIEVYLAGDRFADRWPNQGIPFPPDLRERLRRAYAITHHALQRIPLSFGRASAVVDWLSRVYRWGERARRGGLLSRTAQIQCLRRLIVLDGSEFEIGHGKFALTHLLVTADARIGLIDLAHVRWVPKHYDLAFLLWSTWFRTEPSFLVRAVDVLDWMDAFFIDVAGVRKEKRSEELRRFHRVLLERALGALFDLTTNVEHAKRMLAGADQRRATLQSFLQDLVRLLT